MRGPAHELAQATRDLRRAIDAGSLPVHMVRRQLRGLGLELLRRYPADAELWRGFENLRESGFQPPHAAVIPTGTNDEVLERIWAMSGAELRECASALLELPEPTKDLSRARAVMEILLRTDGESERVGLLLSALEKTEPKERVARWRATAHLRFGGFLPTDDIQQWLEKQTDSLQGVDAARIWRSLAANRLESIESHGRQWVASWGAGNVLLNWEAALRRRPALCDEAPEVNACLQRARESAGLDALGYGPVERTLLSVEEADRDGDYVSGTDALLGVLTRFPESGELLRLAQARAELLMDAELAARLESDFGLECDVEIPVLGPFKAEEQSKFSPSEGWCERLARLGPGAVCAGDDDRFFLEETGALARAVEAWLEQENTEGLNEAARLAKRAEPSLKRRVKDAVLAHLEPDETRLSAGTALTQLGVRLLALLEPGPERRDWCVRLAAAGVRPVEQRIESAVDSDDPHIPANRVAAGEDLLAEGHMDGAAAIAASLMGKLEDVELFDRYLGFVRGIFRSADVPLSLMEVVGRNIRLGGTLSRGLLKLFIEDPRAAHPMLDMLYGIGKDDSASDTLRFNCLRAWLHVWRVTDTVPSDDLIRPFMRNDGGLLALAAATLAGVTDPPRVACEFLESYPPLEHVPSTWARRMLDMGTLEG